MPNIKGTEAQKNDSKAISSILPILILIFVLVLLEGSPFNAVFATEESMISVPASNFSSWSTLASRLEPENSQIATWTLAMPSHTSPKGQLTVYDIYSNDVYPIKKLSFDVEMFGFGGSDRLDEYAVFASVQPYNKFEFGIRMSVSDGEVMGYIIFTPPGMNYIIKEVKLFHNDGLKHHYEVEVQKGRVSFSFDGGPPQYIYGYSFTEDVYGLTATAHRVTDGWGSDGFYMVFENTQIARAGVQRLKGDSSVSAPMEYIYASLGISVVAVIITVYVLIFRRQLVSYFTALRILSNMLSR